MNGSSAINYPINEQLIGKFLVTNVDKLSINNHDEITSQTTAINDESGGVSRFPMTRTEKNFGRVLGKLDEHELFENISNPSINMIDTDTNCLLSKPIVSSTSATVINGDTNGTSVVVTTAPLTFQQRLPMTNTPNVITTGLIHPYPSPALANQSYLLSNHPQFSYYSFYPPPYPPYPNPWTTAALAAASNPFLPPPPLVAPQQPTTSQLQSQINHNDPLRHTDTVSELSGENSVLPSTKLSTPTNDHMQNTSLAAVAPFLYATHHSHPPFVQQASTYATIPSYHPVRPLPTILPRNQPPQTLPYSPFILNNISSTSDTQHSHQVPIVNSPKTVIYQSITPSLKPATSVSSTAVTVTTTTTAASISAGTATIQNNITNDSVKTTQINDLISSSPAPTISQPVPSSLISPLTMTTNNPSATAFNDIWAYTTANSPLHLTQPIQTTANSMNLLHNENSQNTEIANEILRGLATPTKHNSMTDIDNKISAAMDLVKMHLLSAVREEVTELRDQIQTLTEKLSCVEHENTFLRQHVSNEIYSQYTPAFVSLSSSNDSNNSTTLNVPSVSLISSNHVVTSTSISSIPSVALVQQSASSISNQQM